MNKKIVKVLALLLLFSISSSTFACWLSILSDSHRGRTFANDSAEQSYIYYKSGQEKLIISRNFANGNKSTVWVIPVPANPDAVKTNVIPSIPSISGYDVANFSTISHKLEDIRGALVFTQVYPLIPVLLSYIWEGLTPPPRMHDGISSWINFWWDTVWSALGWDSMEDRVNVHSHVEKDGIIVEVLSSKTTEAIRKYLLSKWLKVPEELIPALKDYIGGKYAFVVSWIAPVSPENGTRWVLMDFPTSRMYYPLKPESGTPWKWLPETILVVGHVTPLLFSEIKDETTVWYYHSEDKLDFENFYSSDEGFNFTKIVINTAPKNLVKDLYISNFPPLRILNADFLVLHQIWYGMVLYIIISLVSILIPFYILYRKERKNYKKMAWICFLWLWTFIGVIIGGYLFLKEKRKTFFFSYTAFFMILVVLSTLIQTWYS